MNNPILMIDPDGMASDTTFLGGVIETVNVWAKNTWNYLNSYQFAKTIGDAVSGGQVSEMEYSLYLYQTEGWNSYIYSQIGAAHRENMYSMMSGGYQARTPKLKTVRKLGAIRARTFSNTWKDFSLKTAIDKFAPGAKGKLSANGKKIVYETSSSTKRVIFDKEGNYFRIEDTSVQGKRIYLDLTGSIPNNRVENGRIIGNSQSQYNALTHFNNLDE